MNTCGSCQKSTKCRYVAYEKSCDFCLFDNMDVDVHRKTDPCDSCSNHRNFVFMNIGMGVRK